MLQGNTMQREQENLGWGKRVGGARPRAGAEEGRAGADQSKPAWVTHARRGQGQSHVDV